MDAQKAHAVPGPVCGIDIGKAGLVATIQVPSDKGPGAAGAGTRSFGMRVIT
jgi:hypothetical protein